MCQPCARSLPPVLVVGMLAALLLAGCGPQTGNQPVDPEPPGELVRSNLQRVTSPEAPEADLQSVVDGNTALGLDLYERATAGGGNVFLSPYSISLALAMTYAGAAGNTATQMAQAMHFDLPQDRLHTAFNALDQSVRAGVSARQGDDEAQPFTLDIVNALWAQQGFEMQAAYLDTLALNYGAGVHVVDFASNPDVPRQQINQWVADVTRDRITGLIPQGSLSNMTRLVLTNAIYFLADWAEQFEPNATDRQAFNLLAGGTAQVDMMHQSKDHAYAGGADYQAVQLTYQGSSAAMVIVMPTGDFSAFEAAFDAAALQAIGDGLTTRTVHLSLPKFSFEGPFALADALKALGMTDAFDAALADFSGVTGERDLFIQDARHKAFVAVDEEGTEAAAATSVEQGVTSVPGETDPVTMTVDRPFLFLIRDVPTGTVLFLGRVVDPSA